MRRALDTGLALLLAGGLALAGAPASAAPPAKAGPPAKTAGVPAAAASRKPGLESDHHRGPARVHFIAVSHNGRERRGRHFTAARVRTLKIEVEWRTLVGAHTQQLELITPDGSIYQRFTAPVESVTGRAWVETQVPVAGSWITQHSLEGDWKVHVYLDEAVTPVTTATFTLAK